MGTDISTWGKEPSPYTTASRAQAAAISRIVDDEYEFIIPDWDGGKLKFGPAPGPGGLVAGDPVFAIPVVDGSWFLVSTEFSVSGGGIEEETDPVVGPLLIAHEADTTNIHGIADTSVLATDSDLAAHSADTTGVHGIADTANLVLTGDARLSDARTPLDNSVTSAKIADGAIVNADINAAAAIAYSKLNLAASITHADIALSGIGYAKLSLAGSITNADIAAGAAIAKSKLAALAIVNADVDAAAAIAESKLNLASDAAAGTASRRTLGTGALQAAAGNDARFTDARQPLAGTTFLAADGLVGTPSLSFSTDPNTGIYRSAADTVAIAAGGLVAAQFNASAMFGVPIIQTGDGSAAFPAYSFGLDSNTGMWRSGTDTIALATGGTTRLTLSTTTLTSTLPILAPAGTVSAPGISFSGEPDTGLYTDATDTLVVTAGGAEKIRIAGTITHQVNTRIQDGASASAPGLSFSGQTNTGIRRSTTSTIKIVTNASDRLTIGPTDITQEGGQYLHQLGAVGTPSYSFTGDPNTGIYSPGADQIALATNGVARLTLDATNISQAGGQFFHPLGTAALPSNSFAGDPNTGIWSSGADKIDFSAAGTNRVTIDSNGITMIGSTTVYARLGAAATPVLMARISTDATADRFALYNAGEMYWGPGSAASDVNITRTTTKTLQLAGTLNIRQTTDATNTWCFLVQDNSAGVGTRYLCLMQSNVAGVADNEFYILTDGTVRADGTIVGGGADYAEWFEHDSPMAVGDVVGFNVVTGKVRKYVAGDPLVGVVSDKPAFAAGNPSPMSAEGLPSGYTLVALMGQVDIDPTQVTMDRRSVLTSFDRKRIGFKMANGKVFISVLGIISLPGAA